MGVLLYLLAGLFTVVWGIAVLAFEADHLIHILLVFAIIAVLLRLVAAQRPL